MDFPVILAIVLAACAQGVWGGGRFSTTLLSYTEYQPLTQLGEPCDSQWSMPCDRFFLIKISPEGLKPLLIETPVIRENDFQRVPAFVVRMDRLTSVSYEIAIFDRDDSNPSPLRTKSSSLGVVALSGFDLDSTRPVVTLSANTSESFHGITFRIEVECEKNFFGRRCDRLCVPADGPTGHFSCADNGSKVCNEGFVDPENNCLTPADPCDDITCRNGGVCVPGPDLQGQCQCTKGYTGGFCETRVNPCACNPCSNRGTCVESSEAGEFTCRCAPGWTGELCDDDIDECLEGDSCPIGVNCFNTLGSFTCCVGFVIEVDDKPEVPNTRPPLFPGLQEGTAPPRRRPRPSAPSTAAPTTLAAQTSTTTTTTNTPTPTTTPPTPTTTTPTPTTTTPTLTTTTTTTTTPSPTTTTPSPTTTTPTPTTTTTTTTPTQTPPPAPSSLTSVFSTLPPRFVTQAPRVETQAPSVVTSGPRVFTSTPLSRFIQPSSAPNPNPTVQPRSDLSLCGTPTATLKSILVQNLYQIMRQGFAGLTALDLRNVAVHPTAMAANIRSKCGVPIIGAFFANPRAISQMSCTIAELSKCLHNHRFVSPGTTRAHSTTGSATRAVTSGATRTSRYVSSGNYGVHAARSGNDYR